jgi:hypothetical protein
MSDWRRSLLIGLLLGGCHSNDLVINTVELCIDAS